MINLSSTTQMSILFFGGVIKTKEPKPILNELGCPILIKSGPNRGQVKTKLELVETKVTGLGLLPEKDWVTKKVGIYQTNEKILTIIAKNKEHIAGQIAEKLLQLRGLQKLMGTYYEGMDKFIDENSLIHQNINHTSTNTGRLSSNKPNLQNVGN